MIIDRPTPATQNGLENVIRGWPKWMFCKAFKKHKLIIPSLAVASHPSCWAFCSWWSMPSTVCWSPAPQSRTGVQLPGSEGDASQIKNGTILKRPDFFVSYSKNSQKLSPYVGFQVYSPHTAEIVVYSRPLSINWLAKDPGGCSQGILTAVSGD